MKVKEMLDNMFDLQMQLNNSTNGECWVDGATKEGRYIDWDTAMVLETAEAIDSANWKHWKDINGKLIDIDNYEIEVTDIWHFLMSRVIINPYFNKDIVINMISSYFDGTYIPDSVIIDNKHVKFKDVNRTEYIKQIHINSLGFTGAILANRNKNDIDSAIGLVRTFVKLMELVPNFTIEKLYKLYISKNALNVFRQTHGYKDGTYMKIWSGEEDNVWLRRYVDEATSLTFDGLIAYLDDTYIKKALNK